MLSVRVNMFVFSMFATIHACISPVNTYFHFSQTFFSAMESQMRPNRAENKKTIPARHLSGFDLSSVANYLHDHGKHIKVVFRFDLFLWHIAVIRDEVQLAVRALKSF
jgi:hypothetical protein